MVNVFMACIVMACRRGGLLTRRTSGLYSYGIYSYGLYSNGLYSYGLCSHGLQARRAADEEHEQAVRIEGIVARQEGKVVGIAIAAQVRAHAMCRVLPPQLRHVSSLRHAQEFASPI